MHESPYDGRPFLSVQALRALAALLVVVHHATIMAGSLLRTGRFWDNGASGVDIFFVISGFVITLSAAPPTGKAHSARKFLLRRLKRLVPLYWIATTIQLAVDFYAPSFTVNPHGTLSHVVSSYLFWPTLYHGDISPVLVVGWSLNFEMLFYILVTAALAFGITPPLRFLFPVIFGLAVASHWTLKSHWGVLMLANPLILEFLFGVIIAQCVLQRRRLNHLTSYIALFIAIAFLMTLTFHQGPRCLIWGIPAAALLAAAVGLEDFLAPRIPRWLESLGNSSYSLYLLHALLLPIVAETARRMNIHTLPAVVPVTILAILLSISLGELSYRQLERRLLGMSEKQAVHLAIPRAA